MRTFILLCFVATACAQYNYGAGSSGGSGSGSFNAPKGLASGPSAPTTYNKEFFTFVAPEEQFNPQELQRLLASVKQNIRVIFIKNPENKAYEDAVLRLAAQASQQKTAIYVLNKQHDLAEFANKFNAIQKNANSKPDVHFVKYRTPEDAANAQKAIQSQYDSLGGKSQNFNGGIAPVLNFASQAQRQVPSQTSHQGQSFGGQSTQGQSLGGQSPQSIYLPSSVFRKFRTARRV